MSTNSLAGVFFFVVHFRFCFFRKLMGFGVENPNVLDISFLFSTNQRSTFRHLIFRNYKRRLKTLNRSTVCSKSNYKNNMTKRNSSKKWSQVKWKWCDVMWCVCEAVTKCRPISIWFEKYYEYLVMFTQRILYDIVWVWLRLPRCQSQRVSGGCQIWTLEMYNYAHVAQPTREHYDL